jgi:hypothetical protein
MPAPLNPDGLTNVVRYYGEANVPRSIRRQRHSNMDTMRRFGAPVIIKKMYNDRDVQEGNAVHSPNFSDIYKQTRKDDPLSHGIGFVGATNGVMITQPGEWISPTGTLVIQSADPGAGYTAAPKYRGYGPGYLTYVIMPDVAEDVFKLNPVGVLIRLQQAQAQMGWFPEVNDNDLLITCRVDNSDRVIETYERYLLKMTNPASMRGIDRKGRRERSEDFGNRHVTDQSFEMTLIPKHDELYRVEVDR